MPFLTTVKHQSPPTRSGILERSVMNTPDMRKLSLARDFEVVAEAWWSLSHRERDES
jgi:hypothetical protein